MFYFIRNNLITTILICSILCGCIFNHGYTINIEKEEQETSYSTVYAEITEYRGFENREYMSQLNEESVNRVDNEINEFDRVARESMDAMPAGAKANLTIKQNIKRNSNGILSVVEESYIYLGGAHGSPSWQPITINVKSEAPHPLELKELFIDEERYVDTINRLIDDLREKYPDKYSELWSEPHITKENKNRYYLTDSELVIFFPPYELSYYAKGFIEFPIRLIDLSPLLKDDFKINIKTS